MNITEILDRHAAWLCGEAGGERANLRGDDLCGANLSGDDLCGASLHGTDLRGADLRWANLRGADLSSANLSGADLRWAHLDEADLSGADLSNADLRGVNLSEATLCGARLPDAPAVLRLDSAILAALDAGGELNMDRWHICGTNHCRAGWAITCAGAEGQRLEEEVGPCAAAALIYAASRPNKPVPDFYAIDSDALADLRRCASEES